MGSEGSQATLMAVGCELTSSQLEILRRLRASGWRLSPAVICVESWQSTDRSVCATSPSPVRSLSRKIVCWSWGSGSDALVWHRHSCLRSSGGLNPPATLSGATFPAQGFVEIIPALQMRCALLRARTADPGWSGCRATSPDDRGTVRPLGALQPMKPLSRHRP